MQNLTKFQCVRWLVPLGLMLAALFPAVPAQAEDHVRDGWFIGMGYGYGRGILTASNEQDYSYRNGATPQIRFGHSVGQHFLAGIEYGGWMFEEGDVDFKYRWSLQTVTAALTWHPGPVDGFWGGLYSRAGVGLAWASGARVVLEDQEQVHFDRLDETGLGLIFSLGYEFRISGSAAAGLSVGFNHLDIGKQLYEQARYVPVAMTLNWYWN